MVALLQICSSATQGSASSQEKFATSWFGLLFMLTDVDLECESMSEAVVVASRALGVRSLFISSLVVPTIDR